MDQERPLHEPSFNDYWKLCRFQLGAWAIVLYLIISIVCSLLQIFPFYSLVYWISQTEEAQISNKVYMEVLIALIILSMLFIIVRQLTLQ